MAIRVQDAGIGAAPRQWGWEAAVAVHEARLLRGAIGVFAGLEVADRAESYPKIEKRLKETRELQNFLPERWFGAVQRLVSKMAEGDSLSDAAEKVKWQLDPPVSYAFQRFISTPAVSFGAFQKLVLQVA